MVSHNSFVVAVFNYIGGELFKQDGTFIVVLPDA
jgi:hypothetical protein